MPPVPEPDREASAIHPGAPALDREADQAAPPATVMIVDDEDGIREFVATFLRDEGYRVLPCTSGADAISAAAAQVVIDLLITDVVMPGPSGVEAACAIRRHRPHLPIIFMTGSGIGSDLVTAAAELHAPILEKPFALDELATAVRRALATNRL